MTTAMKGMARGDGAYLIMAALDEGNLSWEAVSLGFELLGTMDPTVDQARLLVTGTKAGSVERVPNFKRSEAERRWRRGVLGGGVEEKHFRCTRNIHTPNTGKAQQKKGSPTRPEGFLRLSESERALLYVDAVEALKGLSDEDLQEEVERLSSR